MNEFESSIIEKGKFANVKLAIFDVGGILYNFMGGVEELSKRTNYPRKKCEAIWREMDDAICRGVTRPEELWNRIKLESRYTGEDIDFIPFWVEHFQPNDSVHQLIKDISKSHAVGLMQNVYPGTYARALLRNKVPSMPLAFNLQSCEVGLVKPEEGIYEIAEQKAGIKGKDILFIDDNAANLTPANRRGWQTFNFNAMQPDTSSSILRTGFAI